MLVRKHVYKWCQSLHAIHVISVKMTVTHVTSMCCTLLILIVLMSKCTAKSKLSLWIDEGQVKEIVGYSFSEFYIIRRGEVIKQLNQTGLAKTLQPLSPDIDTVNLTWEAGDEIYTYWFDNLKSKNPTMLYNPLLSIPSSGIIPKGPKIFQISIPCTGNEEGMAYLVIGLQIMDKNNKPIKGPPIKLMLKKLCKKFETTDLCKRPCEHNGRCNLFGECECTQAYHGPYCEIDMCNPTCENNGTCISPGICLCLDGFYGTRCEQALCTKPCQNGGRCVQPGGVDKGICWCTSGFYGGSCQYSYCAEQPCEHDGLCIGQNKCNCKSGYHGDRCENVPDRLKRRIKKQKLDQIKEEKRKKKCERKRSDVKKRCVKTKTCQSKQERILKRCSNQKQKRQKRCKKRQSKLAARCIKLHEKRRKRCQRKQKEIALHCSNSRIKKINQDIT